VVLPRQYRAGAIRENGASLCPRFGVHRLVGDLEQLKAEGLTGATVAISFCRHLIQPLQDRAHPAFKY
jgi:hypothetical protein